MTYSYSVKLNSFRRSPRRVLVRKLCVIIQGNKHIPMCSEMALLSSHKCPSFITLIDPAPRQLKCLYAYLKVLELLFQCCPGFVKKCSFLLVLLISCLELHRTTLLSVKSNFATFYFLTFSFIFSGDSRSLTASTQGLPSQCNRHLILSGKTINLNQI